MDDSEREYDYKPKWTMIVFCAVFFGLGVPILGSKAAKNDRGLIINGIIELGPESATIFYWALTTFSALALVIAVFFAYHRLAFRQRLVFGPSTLTVPVSRWSHEEKEIAYRDIRALSETAVNGQRFLYVLHPGGKYTITSAMLPSKAVFAEVCELLAAKIRESAG